MKRQKHNLSNYKLTTCDMGKLIPVNCIDVLPGDTMELQSSALIRVSPMLAPIMHPVEVRLHHWFVPYRLIWNEHTEGEGNWEEFITGGPEGNNADTIPGYNNENFQFSLLDYLGIPPGTENANISQLPSRAYNLIYNEFYRDQDLQEEITFNQTDIQNVAWRKDYFTAARPWAQKGNDITIPIGSVAPVHANEAMQQWLISDASRDNSNMYLSEEGGGSYYGDGDGEGQNHHIRDGYLQADLSQATGVTATQFREFFALQRFAEARARYGSRYTEYLQYMGVKPSDARLQRPEYLGGGKQTLQFSEVLQTAPDTQGGEDSFVGSMKGHGITALKSRKTRKFFEEHGVVLTLMSVVPKSIYQDGVQRMFLKQDRNEFFQKELQSIGQQEVYQGEVFIEEGTERDTFGYTDRYNEYTWTPSQITGEFRDTLDFWHLGRKFETTPALNEDFIECRPSKRIFAEQTKHSLWCMVNNKVIARRLVKKQSIGRLM